MKHLIFALLVSLAMPVVAEQPKQQPKQLLKETQN